jgi:enoyl-CoA hydratase/carnithine racemase
MFETIRYAVSNHVATITLNRPERLNAFTPRMSDEIVAAFDKSDADDDVRAVIVTGEGRGFCSGADLGSGDATFDFAASGRDAPIRADGSVDWAHEMVRDNAGKVSLRIYESLKPTIAAINGPAIGAGITITLAMDVRLAVQGAKISFVFARRGIVPEAASSWFLPRIVGVSTALELCMTGRMITAEDAQECGLVRSVHAPEDLIPAAHALADEIAVGAPVSVALTRKMIWQGLSMRVPMEAHRVDSRGVYSRGRSADAREGIMSFLEKRSPNYPDRVSTDLPEWFPWWERAEWR